MSNPFTDKYFEKSRLVAEAAGLNPIVKYRFFSREPGIAAFAPFQILAASLCPHAKVDVLPQGTPFEAKDTIAIVEAPFQDFVEHETQLLQWITLPAVCARNAAAIVKAAKGRKVLDFAARHLFDPTSVALASHGASVGGITGFSTDIGANALDFLRVEAAGYRIIINSTKYCNFPLEGKGTTPHALLAIFGGDYLKMAEAYIGRFPDEPFISLTDYNNKEIDDSLLLLKHIEKKLEGVRIDTCGENHAQIGYNQDGSFKYATEPGVCVEATRALRSALVNNGGDYVEIFVSSGFGEEKTELFVEQCPSSVSGVGTGSFIPKLPSATADIFEVDGRRECKVGREWGYKANDVFWHRRFSEGDL